MAQVKIVILASGEGSLFEALIVAAKSGRLEAQVVGLVTHSQRVPALSRAHKLGIPTYVLGPEPGCDTELVHQAQAVWGADWVVLAGYLRRIGPQALKAFPNRIVNIHPSLLPKFGGKGMYGRRVHEAVLSAGEALTGITVHYVNEKYDAGAIISQQQIPIPSSCTTESLEALIKAAEIQFYPRVLNRLFTGQSTIG